MATDAATIEFLLDQLGRSGSSYTTRRMFGEYCLYRSGLPVAFVCDDVLFVKDTPPGRATIESTMTAQFGPPYPGARPYLRLDPDTWDDGDWLRAVLDVTAAALPAPKAKKQTVRPGADAGAARVQPAKRMGSKAVSKAPAAKKTPVPTRKPKP